MSAASVVLAAAGLLFGSGGVVGAVRAARDLRLARAESAAALAHAEAAKATANASLEDIALKAIGKATDLYERRCDRAEAEAARATEKADACEAKHERCEADLAKIKAQVAKLMKHKVQTPPVELQPVRTRKARAPK